MATGAADAGRPPTLPKSLLGVLATMVLAVLLTLGGANAFGGGGSGGMFSGHGAGRPSLVETARALLRQLLYGERPIMPGRRAERPTLARGKGNAAAPQPPEPADTGALGGFPGVILWPEVRPETMLIAPLPALGTGLFEGRSPRPLSIPFAGEYWMFRWPFPRPPASSFFRRGSPAKLGFSTTDHTPLDMEAHHKLDMPIAVRCCGKIQLEVANADHYPGTLALELVLVGSMAEHGRPLSLGKTPVISKPDQTRDPVMPVLETLDFPVPAQPAIEEFNEFKIVFHRARPRGDKSAKVSIERFVLVPR
jgi:hypothetical protein